MDIKYKVPKVIAEIGCNHMGSFEKAKELIELAAKSGAKYVKFQKRDNDWWATEKPEIYNTAHPEPWNSYGGTYLEHRKALELTAEQHSDLKLFCEQIGVTYSTSVWDVSSAQKIIEIDPEFIKVPSACNLNFELLSLLRDKYNGDIHISFGMTAKDEIDEIINFFSQESDSGNRLVIYSCTSGYPVPADNVALMEIRYLFNKYHDKVKVIGFSGHHLGIALDIAAYTLGAEWIERHFTGDRTWKGTDHAASLEPGGLQKLIRDLKHTYHALNYKDEDILEIEKVQRKKLKSCKRRTV